MTENVNKPGFLKGAPAGDSSADRGHQCPKETRSGETAPAGETFGADLPVENDPFPGSMGG